MSNEQLAILLKGYAQQLSEATRKIGEELPEDFKHIQPMPFKVFGIEDEVVIPILQPLNDILSRLYEDYHILKGDR
jgi:hypothetical protein